MVEELPILLDGRGLIYFDWGLAVLTLVAGTAQMWAVVGTWHSSRREAIARVAVAIGWFVWSLRLWLSLALGFDPIISPPAIFSFMLIGGGSALIVLMRQLR